jgi:hypothetical protein
MTDATIARQENGLWCLGTAGRGGYGNQSE